MAEQTTRKVIHLAQDPHRSFIREGSSAPAQVTFLSPFVIYLTARSKSKGLSLKRVHLTSAEDCRVHGHEFEASFYAAEMRMRSVFLPFSFSFSLSWWTIAWIFFLFIFF